MIEQIGTIKRLHFLLKYTYYETWSPIYRKIRCFEASISGRTRERPVPLTPLQWVAVRRLSWIVDEYRCWLENHKSEIEKWRQAYLNDGEGDGEKVDYYEDIIGMLDSMEQLSQEWFSRVVELDRQRGGVLDEESRKAIEFEIIEEIFFECFRTTLLKPFDESLYCPIARDLLRKLCKASHIYIVSEKESDSATQSPLWELYCEAADTAKEQIEECCRTGDLTGLEFLSGVPEGTVLTGNLYFILDIFKTSSAFYLQNKTTPKGVQAALLDACPDLKSSTKEIRQSIGERFVMVGVPGLSNKYKEVADQPFLAALGSRPMESTKLEAEMCVNKTWYFQWQVLFLVDMFAAVYCSKVYNRNEFCGRLGLDDKIARFVVERGIRDIDGTGYKDFCVSTKKVAILEPPPAELKARAPLQPKKNPSLSKKRRSVSVKHERPVKSEKRTPRISSSQLRANPPVGWTWDGGIPGEKANCRYVGPPTRPFFVEGVEWPEGWLEKIEERLGGKSKGDFDYYWYPPDGTRLRSGPEVRNYYFAAAM